MRNDPSWSEEGAGVPRFGRRTAMMLGTATAATFRLGLPGRAVAETPERGAEPEFEDVPVPPPGALHVSDDAMRAARVGTWTIGFERRSAGAVLVVREGAGRGPVWSSPVGEAFVGAAWSTVDHRDTTRGVFRPLTDYRLVLPDQKVDALRADNATVTVTGTVNGRGTAVAYSVAFRPGAPGHLKVRVEFADAVPGGAGRPDTVLFHARREPGVPVHGFGEQYDSDLAGKRIPVLTREQGVGRGEQPLTDYENRTEDGAGGSPSTTYAPMPWYVTEDLRAFALLTDRYSCFDLTAGNRTSLALHDDSLGADILSGRAPREILARHTEVTGRMRPLPEWTSTGAVLGVQGGTDQVREKIQRTLDAGARISAVWLQDWPGQIQTSFGSRLRWNWELNRKHYPAWEELVSWLHGLDIKVLLYVNPFVCDVSEQPDVGRDLYAEAERLGYLVKDQHGGVYRLPQGGFTAALVDLTNPAAVRWYVDVLVDQVVGVGASGWMADFGEYLPEDARLHAGHAAEWHNRWPRAWAELTAEVRAKADADLVTFNRSADQFSPGVTRLFWAGDQVVDDSREDGLASALLGMLSGGVSGMTLTHSDLGGYTAVQTPQRAYRRSPELLRRWGELAVFTAMMRTHEGNKPGENTQVYDTGETLAAFAWQTRLFSALSDHRLRAEREAAVSGVPVMRPMWTVVPGTWAARADEQFFFGDSLLVAPVLREGQRAVDVILPPGRWVLLWTGEAHGSSGKSTTVTVPAPLGQPPVFCRTDAPWGTALRAEVARIPR